MADPRIDEIEAILREEGDLSMILADNYLPDGLAAMAFPLGHRSGVLMNPPMGTGASELDAAESLLDDWRSRRA